MREMIMDKLLYILHAHLVH